MDSESDHAGLGSLAAGVLAHAREVLMLRMAKAPYRRALLPLSEDAATRLVHLAGIFLTHGQPEKAASAYKAAACYAQTPQGQRECWLMAAELEFGLLVTATVH